MKTAWVNRVSIVAFAVVVLWSFVGAEHIIDDHEVGTSWQIFIKHRPSLHFTFKNPAQKGLEIVDYKALSSSDRSSFLEFCNIRFGIIEPSQCQTILKNRAI
jgi:hypothetical protein